MSILKVIYLVPLFFQISYLLLSKIVICLEYFSDRNPQKLPLWQGVSCIRKNEPAAPVRARTSQEEFRTERAYRRRYLELEGVRAPAPL